MKKRVALIAIFLNLFICFAFLMITSGSAIRNINTETGKNLESLCRMSKFSLDNAAFSIRDKVSLLDEAAKDHEIDFAFYSSNGDTVYTNNPGNADFLSSAERNLASQDIYTFSRNNANSGEKRIYAAACLEDSYFLIVSSPAGNWLDFIRNNAFWIIGAFTLCFIIEILLLRYSVQRNTVLVNSLINVIEDFSEGLYDKRISPLEANSPREAAAINEALSHLQEKVFTQRSRNHALGTVLNHMQNGILAVDNDLNIILVTPAAKKLLEINGSPEGVPLQLASKDKTLEKLMREAMEQNGVLTGEIVIPAQNEHDNTPVRLYISPMLKDAETVGAVALVEDISELRRLEQIRTDFAANVSHELKTPLTSIKGFVETLEAGAIENKETAYKFLRIIRMEADRLSRLINDILTVTKMESGMESVPEVRIRIDEVARDVADMLDITAKNKEVTIYTNENTGPSYVMGDPDRVEQLLINLIENAIKYNVTGGSVHVSVFNSDKEVYISVSDTGIGIDEEHIPRLFERFYRVDKGRSRSMGGTGLGLSIVKHIVQSMNGTIEVHSKPSEGTEFLITLPRAQ